MHRHPEMGSRALGDVRAIFVQVLENYWTSALVLW